MITSFRKAIIRRGCPLAWSALLAASPVRSGEFVKGADISSLPRVEEGGGAFTEGGIPGDALEILAGHGIDFVRLRIWHSPADGDCGLEKALGLAARAKALGLGLLIDLHYSDTWADPGNQHIPAAWKGLSAPELADSVYRYTREVVTAFGRQGTIPEWVQIGNEITCGMLWDDGRICGEWDDPPHWSRLGELVKAGIAGVRDAGDGAGIKTMIHVDDGADNSLCVRFFDNLAAEGVEFDLIGLSFYPWWHGTLEDLSRNIDDLASRYGRGIVVVETAYPFTLGWNDGTHNSIGLESQLHEGYPATREGQETFVRALIDTVRSLPGGLGAGVFYWEPAWISAPSYGSPWENLALFGFDGELLPSARAFEQQEGPAGPDAHLPRRLEYLDRRSR